MTPRESLEYNRAWRAANPEKVRGYAKKRYAFFGDAIRAVAREKYAASPRKSNEASYAWQLANPERAAANRKAYNVRNKDAINASRRARYALRASAGTVVAPLQSAEDRRLQMNQLIRAAMQQEAATRRTIESLKDEE